MDTLQNGKIRKVFLDRKYMNVQQILVIKLQDSQTTFWAFRIRKINNNLTETGKNNNQVFFRKQEGLKALSRSPE